MRIAIIAETFLPTVNGVTHSLERILEHLADRGDDVMVIAPSSTDTGDVDTGIDALVIRLPSIPLAGYTSIRLAVGGVARVRKILAMFAPDVIHLASPFELGWRAARAARQLGIPTVAVYQTDVAGYAARYGLPLLAEWGWQRVQNIHSVATRTLVPSTSALTQLLDRDIPRLRLWGRGVDADRFHPAKRSAELRARFAPNGEHLIGYVGRLAAEKQVEDVAALAGLAGSRLVIIGDGPQRKKLETLLPDAVFTGFLTGEMLAVAMASLDLFVHPGESETFCQTIQEAMASGVPVVATGRGGPVDLVASSHTGWLYQPGDLEQMRQQVIDLLGDNAKRTAFAEAARASVHGRTWPVLCEQLVDHYKDAVAEHTVLQD